MDDNSIRMRGGQRLLLAAALVALLAANGVAAARDAVRPARAAPAGDLAPASRAAAAAQKVWQGAQDVAVFALGLLGVSYRWGGETPDRGVDCSGLIRYVFQEVTGTTLPRTSRELSRLGEKVAIADLQPGDLVFFNTRRFAFSHVGLYLGDNRFIHAPATGREVEIATLSQSYWHKHFNGARRLVGVLPSLVPNVIGTALAASPARGDLPAASASPSAAGLAPGATTTITTAATSAQAPGEMPSTGAATLPPPNEFTP